MGIPAGETIVALSCPAATRRLGPSAIVGRVLDADTDQPVPGARISFAWSELSLADGLRRMPRVRVAAVNADGVFRICGVPAEVEGTLQAERSGITTAEIKVTFIGQPLVAGADESWLRRAAVFGDELPEGSGCASRQGRQREWRADA
jgi:hypothetical protein